MSKPTVNPALLQFPQTCSFTTGMDASQEFDDVGHSKDAINIRDKLLVGDFDMSTIGELEGGDSKQASASGGGGGGGAAIAIPIVVLMIILAIIFKQIPLGK